MKTITLYEENKIDKEYELTFEEVYNKFIETEYYKDFKERGAYMLTQGVTLFIGSKDGLNSAYDIEEDRETLDELIEYIRLKIKGERWFFKLDGDMSNNALRADIKTLNEAKEEVMKLMRIKKLPNKIKFWQDTL